jgi:hypothetical protein
MDMQAHYNLKNIHCYWNVTVLFYDNSDTFAQENVKYKMSRRYPSSFKKWSEAFSLVNN